MTEDIVGDQSEVGENADYRFNFHVDKDFDPNTLIVHIDLGLIPDDNLKKTFEENITNWAKKESESLELDLEYVLVEQFDPDKPDLEEGEIFLWKGDSLEIGPSGDLVGDGSSIIRLVDELNVNDSLPIKEIKLGSGYEW